MDTLKAAVNVLMQPLSLWLIVTAAGLALLRFTRRQRAGKVLAAAGVLLVWGGGCEPIADLLVAPLEGRYSPLLASEINLPRDRVVEQVKWVVVLGAGQTLDPKLPATSQISGPALARLVEGLRLHRLLPGTRVVLSGAAPPGAEPHAEVMARAARALGADAGMLVTNPGSRNTEEEAVAISRIVGKDHFVLVTSAIHLRRSVSLFRKQGTDPIPAPADYLIKREGGGFNLFPDWRALRKMEAASHEWVGLIWSALRGRT